MSLRQGNVDIKRLGRAFAALSLGVAVLGLALGISSALPAAEAQEIAAAAPNSPTNLSDSALIQSDTLTPYAYLPLVFREENPLVFFDDFSNPNSGWPVGADGDRCSFGYYNDRYRVRVTTDQEHCIVPAVPVPKQLNGTFSFRVRRSSDKDRAVQYGFLFGAGADAFEDRWMLEVRPDKVTCDGNTKPYFWLSARENDNDQFFDYTCTDAIGTDNDWNEIKVIRYVDQNNKNNDFIKIYINGQLKGDYRGYNDDIDHLRDPNQFGFFDLVALALDENTSTSKSLDVEFDDFKIETTTN